MPAVNIRGKCGTDRGIFVDSDLPKEFVDRVSYIVSHHHTITGIDGIDYQIMIEADYLVNADESNFSGNNVRNMLENIQNRDRKIPAPVYVSEEIEC